MIRTIKLYGNLGKKFSKYHKFSVRTPLEAIKALIANYPDFRKELLSDKVQGYKIYVGKEDRSTIDETVLPADADISIVPIIQGAGGAGKIIIGAVLIYLAVVTGGAALAMAQAATAAGGGAAGMAASAATAGTLGVGGTIAGALGSYATLAVSIMQSMGIALLMGGISQMLYSPTKLSTAAQVEQNPSAYFNGAVNLSEQGNCVPLAYGKVLTGSVVISAGIKTTKASTNPPVASNNIQPGFAGRSLFSSLVTFANLFNDNGYVKITLSGTDADGTISRFIVTSISGDSGTLYSSKSTSNPIPINSNINATDNKAVIYYKPTKPTGEIDVTYLAVDNLDTQSNGVTAKVKWVSIDPNTVTQELDPSVA